MPAPLSMDLRLRIIEAYEAGGVTQGEVAERFEVGVATMVKETPDASLDELATAWATKHPSRAVSRQTLGRVLLDRGITRKKVADSRRTKASRSPAAAPGVHGVDGYSRSVSSVLCGRVGQPQAMTRLFGRAPAGRRVTQHVPRNRGTVLTMIAALTLTGMVALMTIVGGTSGPVFTAYVEHVLVPHLKRGDIASWTT